ncbi:MAG: FGGY-family carbohydrate kinase [Chitinophagaceae bacterium]
MENSFIGIDVGTQGARAVLLDSRGGVAGEKEQAFLLDDRSREEQSPHIWWEACKSILEALVADAGKNIDLRGLKAISVTSTSGTVIPLDKYNEPLHDALMYSDKRSEEVAAECQEAAIQYFGENPAYTNFNASSGLCKMVWYVKHFPSKVSRINKWVHAADFILGKLYGNFTVTDETNGLKSGYDIFTRSWPDYLYKKLPLKKDWLPKVVQSGTPTAFLDPSLAHRLNLPRNVRVVAGMTDGCASQVASGAAYPGDWNTTIGTTLVIKGVTTRPIIDPYGRIYNHRHPEGYFMPGGASNTGADWITKRFGNRLEYLNQMAAQLYPTGKMAWPLLQEGERFPFIAGEARGFEPFGASREELFTANMEGVAYIERYAYEIIEQLSGEKVKAIYTAGGGSNSAAWLAIRSCVSKLPVYRMKHVSGAVGAAIVASSHTCFHSLSEAVKALTQVEKRIDPQEAIANQYDAYYKQFINTLKKRGYIKN